LFVELPDPLNIPLNEYGLTLTVWFDFFGYFTNIVIIYTAVKNGLGGDSANTGCYDRIALLDLPECVEANCVILEPDHSGGSTLVRTLVKYLQKIKGPLKFNARVVDVNQQKVFYMKEVCFEDVLITKLCEMK
uniref:N-acetyltransferase domain-containing protein n=1 Tax=Soboliphyme baturini TaxID=241478 RepID=A0A183IYQ2_9BILA